MGNINQINNDIPQFINKNKNPDAANHDGNTFKQTFGQVLENMESSKMEIAQSEGLKEIPAQSFQLTDPSVTISDKTEKLLEMLELYSAKLEDGTISLKDVDPLLSQIQIEAESLLQKVESSPNADESIKNIAKEFAVFANTEQIKFQRGDYLS